MFRIRNFFLSLSQNIPSFASSGAYCTAHHSDLENAMTLSDCVAHRLVNHGAGRSAACVDTLQQFIAWLPGNLFVGPTNRSDDPGDGFESNAEQVVGTDRYRTLLELYKLMNTYNRNVAEGNNNDDIIGKIATYLNRVAQTRRVTRLNAGNWEKDGAGYRLRRNFRQENYTFRDESIAPECKRLKSRYEEIKARKKILHDET